MYHDFIELSRTSPFNKISDSTEFCQAAQKCILKLPPIKSLQGLQGLICNSLFSAAINFTVILKEINFSHDLSFKFQRSVIFSVQLE